MVRALGGQLRLRDGRGAARPRGRRRFGMHPAVVRAVAWLASVQNEDGGFGEDCRSYDNGEVGIPWRGRGVSTPSQTAWALIGLVAAGEEHSDAAATRPGGWCEHQRDDGDWDEEHFTGTGFPRDFLIRYHLYRIVWPVMALGRLVGNRDDGHT